MAQSSGHAHDLRTALEQPGCPVCQLSRRSVERYLDIFGFESVNDVGLRERIRAARGLCNYHGWQFLDATGEILGTAIIVRDLLRTLHRETALLAPDAAFEQCLLPTTPCLVCEVRRESAAGYLAALVEQLADAGFRRAFERSDGLCWHHLSEGLRQANARSGRYLVISWQQTIDRLQDGARQMPTNDPPPPAVATAAQPSAASSDRRPVRAGKPLGADVGLRRPRPVAHRLWAVCFGEPGLTDHFGDVDSLVVAAVAGPRDGTVTVCRAEDAPLEPETCLVCAAVESDRRRRLQSSNHPAQASLCNRHAHLRAPASDLSALLGAVDARLRSVEVVSDSRSMLTPARVWDALRFRLGVSRSGWRERGDGTHAIEAFCAECQAQAAVEAAAISGLAQANPYDSEAGLCRIHLRLALASGLPEHLKRWLIVRQHQIWERLSDELGEYIRKQDYRFRDEPRGVEQSSPWRGLEALAGQQGVR